jgi:DNA-binding transcriptional LysR family regulator
MEFQHVRYFLAVCEERSFVRAARRCGIAQPSLTNAIKRFESQLGRTLFLRAGPHHRQTTPTSLALAIKPYFEHALANLEQAKQVAATFRLRQRPLPVTKSSRDEVIA